MHLLDWRGGRWSKLSFLLYLRFKKSLFSLSVSFLSSQKEDTFRPPNIEALFWGVHTPHRLYAMSGFLSDLLDFSTRKWSLLSFSFPRGVRLTSSDNFLVHFVVSCLHRLVLLLPVLRFRYFFVEKVSAEFPWAFFPEKKQKGEDACMFIRLRRM